MFGADLDLTTVAVIAGLFVLAHIVLLITSSKLNALMVLAAGFFVLSPLSAATESALVLPAKYGRVYVTVLMFVLGIFVMRAWRLRPTGLLYLLFAGYLAMAGMWSEAPQDALLYKGLYVAVVVAGLFLAYSVRDLSELRAGLRLFGLAGGVFALLILLELVRNPTAISHIGRLEAWGMNGNRLGQTAAPLLIVCAFLAFHDPAKWWKIFGYVVLSILSIVIFYTGSRGAAGEAALGCFIVGIPLIRRPVLAFTVGASAVLLGLAVYKMIGIGSTDASQRFLDTSLSTREDVWRYAMDQFRMSPIFGIGWASQTSQGATDATMENMHSMYMQVLVETGLIGLTLMLSILAMIFWRVMRATAYIRAVGRAVPYWCLTLAIMAAVFAHGFFEAGSLAASMVNSLLLPFALGLVDRLPELVAEEEWWEAQAPAAEAEAWLAQPA